MNIYLKDIKKNSLNIASTFITTNSNSFMFAYMFTPHTSFWFVTLTKTKIISFVLHYKISFQIIMLRCSKYVLLLGICFITFVLDFHVHQSILFFSISALKLLQSTRRFFIFIFFLLNIFGFITLNNLFVFECLLHLLPFPCVLIQSTTSLYSSHEKFSHPLWVNHLVPSFDLLPIMICFAMV